MRYVSQFGSCLVAWEYNGIAFLSNDSSMDGTGALRLNAVAAA